MVKNKDRISPIQWHKKVGEADHGVSYISINEMVVGKFNFQNKYRSGLEPLIKNLVQSIKFLS